MQIVAYTPRTDRKVNAVVVDLDGADHSANALRSPADAARYLAAAADCYGLLPGLLTVKSRRGNGRHVWLFPPGPVSLEIAVDALARLLFRAMALRNDDLGDGASDPFISANGEAVQPGKAGAFEMRPHSTEAPDFGWGTLLPFCGHAAKNYGGGIAVDPFDDAPIELDAVPACDATRWGELTDRASQVKPKPKPVAHSRTSGIPSNFGSARRYLAKLPAAVSGSGGHDATFHAACICLDKFGLHDADAIALMLEFNLRCQPPWRESEIERKVREARKAVGR